MRLVLSSLTVVNPRHHSKCVQARSSLQSCRFSYPRNLHCHSIYNTAIHDNFVFQKKDFYRSQFFLKFKMKLSAILLARLTYTLITTMSFLKWPSSKNGKLWPINGSGFMETTFENHFWQDGVDQMENGKKDDSRRRLTN